MARIYSTAEWDRLRRAALERDSFECTAEGLVGTPCVGVLHVHHEHDRPLDLDSVLTLCAAHHAEMHALRRRQEAQHEQRQRQERLQERAR